MFRHLVDVGWSAQRERDRLTGATRPGEMNDTVASCETGYCKAEFSLAHTGDLHAMAKQVDECVFNGDTSSTYFGHFGIIPKLKDINGVDDGGGLVLGTGNAWSELTLTDLEKLAGTIPNYADENAKWYCHRKFFFTVIAKLVLDAGGVTATEMEGRRQLQFLGYPVELSQVMPKTEANSQVPVVFGDMRQAVTLGRRREMTVDTSRDYKFAERQLTFLGTRRIAINCHSLGSATEAGPMAGLITAAS